MSLLNNIRLFRTLRKMKALVTDHVAGYATLKTWQRNTGLSSSSLDKASLRRLFVDILADDTFRALVHKLKQHSPDEITTALVEHIGKPSSSSIHPRTEFVSSQIILEVLVKLNVARDPSVWAPSSFSSNPVKIELSDEDFEMMKGLLGGTWRI